MRRSFRGRSRTISSASLSSSATTDTGSYDRKKIAHTLNLEAGLKEKGGGARGARARGGGRARINSEPISSKFERSQSPPLGGADQVPPEMMGVVTHLKFADTYVSGMGGWSH